MAKPLQVELTESEQMELEQLRDHSAKAYLRERAAAILKLAAGLSGREVAHHGLLKRRKHQTVCGWVQRYQAEGVAGLIIRRGRGRKAAFSP
jgi:transposase